MGGKGKHPDSGGFIYYGPSPSHRVLTLKKRDYDTDDSNCPLSFSLFLSRSLLHPHPLLSTSFYSAPSAGIDNNEEKGGGKNFVHRWSYFLKQKEKKEQL